MPKRRASNTMFLSLGLLATLVLPGCGGGGGGGGGAAAVETRTSQIKLGINWAARSRSVDAPSSALSAVIMLKDANPTGADYSFTVNRRPDPAAYSETVTSPGAALIGLRDLSVRFFALADG